MSSQSASHALRCHRSQGRRGRSVSRILRQPPPPVHRGSSTTAPPSKTLLTLSQTLFTLSQKGLTSRGEFLGRLSLTETLAIPTHSSKRWKNACTSPTLFFSYATPMELDGRTLDQAYARSRRDDPRQRETRRSIECAVFGLRAFLPPRRDQHVEVGQLAVGRDVSRRDDFFCQEEFAMWSHHAAAVREDIHSAVAIP